MNALGELTALLKRRGLEDAKLNVYRVISGRSDYTRLAFNLPSSERLPALLDALGSERWAADWITSSAKFRAVMCNGTYRKISR